MEGRRGERLVPFVNRAVNKQLAQVRPANTTAVSAYSPSEGVTAIIKWIEICNTSGSSADFRLFHDDDGTTYDETTALAWDEPVAADDSYGVEVYYPVKSTGNFAVRTDTNSALTFTLYGEEIS